MRINDGGKDCADRQAGGSFLQKILITSEQKPSQDQRTIKKLRIWKAGRTVFL